MSEKRFKIWTATNDADAGVMVTPKASMLVGSSKNYIVADGTGLSLVGKSISMGTTGENIRQGGLFLKMNDFVSMIPSTFTTPIPPQIPFPPLGMITSIVSDLPFFLMMMAG